jgi:hypothetical protein
MELGQGPNWGCSTKERKVRETGFSVEGTKEMGKIIIINDETKPLYIRNCTVKKEIYHLLLQNAARANTRLITPT